MIQESAHTALHFLKSKKTLVGLSVLDVVTTYFDIHNPRIGESNPHVIEVLRTQGFEGFISDKSVSVLAFLAILGFAELAARYFKKTGSPRRAGFAQNAANVATIGLNSVLYVVVATNAYELLTKSF